MEVVGIALVATANIVVHTNDAIIGRVIPGKNGCIILRKTMEEENTGAALPPHNDDDTVLCRPHGVIDLSGSAIWPRFSEFPTHLACCTYLHTPRHGDWSNNHRPKRPTPSRQVDE